MMNPSPRFDEARVDLATELILSRSFLTADMQHPLVIERDAFVGKERGFKLARHRKDPDSPLSPYYANLRMLDDGGALSPGTIDRAARCMRGVLDAEEVRFGAVIGVPNAGNPFADAIARIYGDAMPRLAHQKDGGKRAPYAAKGTLPEPGTKVLIVDDVIAGGTSKIPTIECVLEAGYAVTDIVVLIDREEGGVEELYERYRKQCHVHSVYTIRKLVGIYYRNGRITKEMYESIILYVSSFQ